MKCTTATATLLLSLIDYHHFDLCPPPPNYYPPYYRRWNRCMKEGRSRVVSVQQQKVFLSIKNSFFFRKWKERPSRVLLSLELMREGRKDGVGGGGMSKNDLPFCCLKRRRPLHVNNSCLFYAIVVLCAASAMLFFSVQSHLTFRSFTINKLIMQNKW